MPFWTPFETQTSLEWTHFNHLSTWLVQYLNPFFIVIFVQLFLLQGLREMLEISFRNGSYTDPLVGPKMVTRAIQTEPPTSTASALSSSLSPSSSSTTVDQTSGGVKIYGYSQTNRTEENHENGRPTSSLNGNALSTPNSASNESLRPLSSASEESEETSSISDDDEIIFNTIKRQVKKPDVMSIFGIKNVEQKADAFVQNNFEQKADSFVEHFNNCEKECDATDDEHDLSAVNNETTFTDASKIEKSTTSVDDNSLENTLAEGDEPLVKVNGDNHLSDNLMDKQQQQQVLSQS